MQPIYRKNNCLDLPYFVVIFILLLNFIFSSSAIGQESNVTPYPAPKIQGISAWINSPPLTIQQLHGKVVLIDFWTYSCINCIRSLPYIKTWDEKYRNQGLVIIGIHSPEFPFEKEVKNVQQALNKYQIKYPVALDNDYITWHNYNNNFWPAHYLINRDGNVVYTHFGEGEYGKTENKIRELLGEKPMKNLPNEQVPISISQTPETYLGYARSERFKTLEPAVNIYQYPEKLQLHEWALKGNWERAAEKITALKSGATIKLHFYAKKVFLVLGSKNNTLISVNILLNGKLIGTKNIEHATLYELLNLPEIQEGTVEITAQSPGLEAYAFTFGG